MSREQFMELRKLANETNNVVLSALLNLYEARVIGMEMTINEWKHYAIITLAKHNSELQKQLIDWSMRSPYPPIIKNLP